MMLWNLEKNGHDAKCTARTQGDMFEVAVLIDGMRLQSHRCALHAEVKRWALVERRVWTSNGWQEIA